MTTNGNGDNKLPESGPGMNGLLSLEAKVEAPFIEQAAKMVNNIGKSDLEVAKENANEKVRKLLEGHETREPMFFESMTQAVDPQGGAKIRVWRHSDTIPEYNDIELQLLISKIPGMASMKQVFDILSTVPGVTAIELTDPIGNGAVAYYEW